MSDSDTLVVTGAGGCEGDPTASADVLPWLLARKSRKYMGKQDEMAVIAAGRALQDAGLSDQPERRRDMGLYLAIGHIPFQRGDIEAIARRSVDAAGRFDLRAFAGDGIGQVNPLLTFRCLPNMPAFHVSLNFGVQGPSMVSHPGIAQAYAVLQQACRDLRDGRIEQALVGAVADQHNFLVDFHHARSPLPQQAARLDAAAFICLERPAAAQARAATVRLRLLQLGVDGAATPGIEPAPSCCQLALGLLHTVAAGGAAYEHQALGPDGLRVHSRWAS